MSQVSATIVFISDVLIFCLAHSCFPIIPCMDCCLCILQVQVCFLSNPTICEENQDHWCQGSLGWHSQSATLVTKSVRFWPWTHHCEHHISGRKLSSLPSKRSSQRVTSWYFTVFLRGISMLCMHMLPLIMMIRSFVRCGFVTRLPWRRIAPWRQ